MNFNEEEREMIRRVIESRIAEIRDEVRAVDDDDEREYYKNAVRVATEIVRKLNDA